MSKRQRLTLATTAALAAVLLAACVQETPEPTTSPETPAPTSSTSPAPSDDAAADESRCGVPGFEDESSLVQAPEAEWAYLDTSAVPTSDALGPAEITADGVRACFAHTAAGAVTMAYYAIVQGSSADLMTPFTEYAYTGPGRDALVAGVTGEGSDGRITLQGFRVLAYDGDTARIDVAARVDTSGSNSLGSAVYELTWENGDWHIYAQSADEPGVNISSISSLQGYTPWSE